jgi:hypothetical protein
LSGRIKDEATADGTVAIIRSARGLELHENPSAPNMAHREPEAPWDLLARLGAWGGSIVVDRDATNVQLP